MDSRGTGLLGPVESYRGDALVLGASSGGRSEADFFSAEGKASNMPRHGGRRRHITDWGGQGPDGA
jgi:hypothetical protein